jgi:hypothetical protein
VLLAHTGGAPDGHLAHVLDATGDHEVVDAGHDPLGGELDRLLAGTASPVDRRRRDGLGKARREPAGARRIARLGADLIRAPEDHIVDGVGGDTRALHHGPHRKPAEVGGVDRGIRAVAPADRRADRLDDEGLTHRGAPA